MSVATDADRLLAEINSKRHVIEKRASRTAFERREGRTLGKDLMKLGRGLSTSLAVAAALLATSAGSAREGLEDAVFAERQTLTGSYLAGRVAGNSGDNRAAAFFLKKALDDDPDNIVLIERVFLSHLSNGEMDLAFKHAEDLIEKQPANRNARFALALKDMRGRNFASARRHLAEAQSGTLSDLTGGLMDAWALQGLGKTNEAIAAIDALTGAPWYEIFKNLHRGLINAQAGNVEDARRDLQAVYKAESGTMRFVETMARFEARNGGTETALSILEAFKTVVPNHPNIEALIAKINAGERVAPVVSFAHEGAGEAVLGLGLALAREGGEDIATVYLRLAVFAFDGSTTALAALADVYERERRYEEAISVYELVPEEAAIWRSTETKRALNIDALERTDEAVEILNGLIAAYPDESEPILALGNVYRARERFEEAAGAYGRIISKIETPTRANWTVYYYRGIANERSQNWKQAEADLLQALELFPDHPLVLNYLGYSWVDKGLRLDDGLDMIKKAVAQRPRDGYIVDSLGWVYYRLGQFDQAVIHLERAVELRPQDPVINDHLGDAYWKEGRKLEARFQWNHARDLDPEPADLKKIEAKLRDGLPSEDIDAAGTPSTSDGG